MGTNYRVDPGDIVNTKQALTDLGYYKIPPHRGIDDWTDDAMFDGIRSFQKDNDLKVDGFMRPGGPTERTINTELAAAGTPAPPPRPTRKPAPNRLASSRVRSGIGFFGDKKEVVAAVAAIPTGGLAMKNSANNVMRRIRAAAVA